MISLMLSLVLLLLTFIMTNSTPPNSRQTPFFDRLRQEKWGPPKIKSFDQFLQARVSNLKEHVFDMPISLNYGSTGRPPGKFHLRHSLKEIVCFSEFPYPPFDIFFIESTSNVNNNYIWDDNGGSGTDNKAVSVGNDSDTATEADINTNINTNVVVGLPVGLPEWFTDQIESIHFWYLYKYKFNIDGIPTTTTTTTTTPVTATATINYKTSAEGISNEDGDNAEAPGLSFTDWIESTTISNNSNTGSISTSTTNTTTNEDNDNETFHHYFLFKLISLYLIITKSISSKEFTKQPKEKHHHQQEHYHVKDRHQYHLEQQQKHQHFKQQHHNVERMAAFIVLKLTLVAWDMWTYQNGF
jgi:hypothetical protein